MSMGHDTPAAAASPAPKPGGAPRAAAAAPAPGAETAGVTGAKLPRTGAATSRLLLVLAGLALTAGGFSVLGAAHRRLHSHPEVAAVRSASDGRMTNNVSHFCHNGVPV